MGNEAVGVGHDATPARRAHVDLMRRIVRAAADLPLALKGGTALLLCYGLDRFSEDLDFDGNKKVNLAARIGRVLAAGGGDGGSVQATKDTDVVQRLRVLYPALDGTGRLKVETSYRDGFDPADTVLVDGVRTYRVSRLVGMKVSAFLDRTTARDLYDLRFLAKNFRDDFSASDSAMMATAVADPDALHGRFHDAFEDDDILRDVSLDEVILDISERFGGTSAR